MIFFLFQLGLIFSILNNSIVTKSLNAPLGVAFSLAYGILAGLTVAESPWFDLQDLMK